MSDPMTNEQRAQILALLGEAKPATDGLIVTFGKSIANRRNHEHDKWEDLYCANLAAYMGERVAPVLRRLLDAEARVAELESWADAREAREDEILGLLATVDLVTSPQAWDLGMAITSHLDGPPARPTDEDREEGLRALITKLAARVAELEAEKDTHEGESTPAPIRHPKLGLFILCSGQGCQTGEWSTKAEPRGWERPAGAWLCVQCASAWADREDFLRSQAVRAAASLQALGDPSWLGTEVIGHDVRLHIRLASPQAWSEWADRLDHDINRTTHRGNGVISSHGTWDGVHIAIRCDIVPPTKSGDQ